MEQVICAKVLSLRFDLVIQFRCVQALYAYQAQPSPYFSDQAESDFCPK